MVPWECRHSPEGTSSIPSLHPWSGKQKKQTITSQKMPQNQANLAHFLSLMELSSTMIQSLLKCHTYAFYDHECVTHMLWPWMCHTYTFYKHECVTLTHSMSMNVSHLHILWAWMCHTYTFYEHECVTLTHSISIDVSHLQVLQPWMCHTGSTVMNASHLQVLQSWMCHTYRFYSHVCVMLWGIWMHPYHCLPVHRVSQIEVREWQHQRNGKMIHCEEGEKRQQCTTSTSALNVMLHIHHMHEKTLTFTAHLIHNFPQNPSLEILSRRLSNDTFHWKTSLSCYF